VKRRKNISIEKEEKKNNLTDGRSLSTYQSIISLGLFD